MEKKTSIIIIIIIFIKNFVIFYPLSPQTRPLHENLVLYMNIFEMLLRTIYKLHGNKMIHFDIKV